MKTKLIITTTLLLICFLAFPQEALEIVKKMDGVLFAAKDRQGMVTITTINQSGKEKVREAEMYQKGQYMKLYRYTAPESQAGIATLSLPDGVMWMYMPAFGKPKKITLLAKSQAFTGTDFSYEDMSVSSYSGEYTPALAETTAETYVVELVPLNEKSEYSKIVVTIDKGRFTPQKMEYFDRMGKKFKESTYKYIKSGKYWYAEEVIMADLRKQHMTRIQMTSVSFDQGLSDDLFTVENLVPADNQAKE